MEVTDFWIRFTGALHDSELSVKQTDIAKRYGVSQPSVHRWKKDGLPEPAKMIEIAEDLGVCVEWLYTGRGNKHPVVTRDSTDEELLSLLSGFDEQDKQEVLKFARFRAKD